MLSSIFDDRRIDKKLSYKTIPSSHITIDSMGSITKISDQSRISSQAYFLSPILFQFFQAATLNLSALSFKMVIFAHK